jgi:hypothetical protein
MKMDKESIKNACILVLGIFLGFGGAALFDLINK